MTMSFCRSLLSFKVWAAQRLVADCCSFAFKHLNERTGTPYVVVYHGPAHTFCPNVDAVCGGHVVRTIPTKHQLVRSTVWAQWGG